ncbi:hypothetical protein NWP10_09305, partial [Micrococcus sp. HG099]|uniref:hypothetical protein n=1 Tax=Micrococcus sp. HG099 TaxID=2969755 RepID=UPI00215B1EF1
RQTLVEAVTALLAARLDADAVLRAAVHVPRRSLPETPAPELEDGALVWGEGRPLVALPAARA